MKRLVLAGGGHAHLFVLEALARRRHADLEVVLLTPSRWQYYSGMLPGLVSGRFKRDEIRIDLERLAKRARVRLVLQPMVAMRADRNCVCLADGTHIEYDLLSLDTGAETDDSWLLALGERLLNIKPLDAFIDAWERYAAGSADLPPGDIIVAGGGAGGVEMAVALAEALRRMPGAHGVQLAAGAGGVVPSFPPSARRLASIALKRAGVRVVDARVAAEPARLLLSDGRRLDAGLVVASTGVKPPEWLTLSDLALAEDGFVATGTDLRSVSHANVFAVGDVATRTGVKLAKSGVHSVRSGPVLAANLLSARADGGLRKYRPRSASLYILSSGAGRAIACYGGLVFEGKWVLKWKDYIDRRFIARFEGAGQ